jgi:hypothetical protein
MIHDSTHTPSETDLPLYFFRVMANADRIRLAALLMTRDGATLAEIAAGLDMKDREALDHLAALREVGLAQADAPTSSAPTAYRFDLEALYAMQRAVLSRANQRTPVDDIADPATRKLLRNFFDGDRLKIIPESPHKFALLVRWLVTQFEVDRRYSEREVNAIISRYHEDYATLRREMINLRLMARENGVYWRITSSEA